MAQAEQAPEFGDGLVLARIVASLEHMRGSIQGLERNPTVCGSSLMGGALLHGVLTRCLRARDPADVCCPAAKHQAQFGGASQEEGMLTIAAVVVVP